MESQPDIFLLLHLLMAFQDTIDIVTSFTVLSFHPLTYQYIYIIQYKNKIVVSACVITIILSSFSFWLQVSFNMSKIYP